MLYLVLWPVDIDPAIWLPPKDHGFVGSFSVNEKLTDSKRITLPRGRGPEDIAVGPNGWVYGGLEDGRIIRTKDGKFEDFANTGGRPLGLHFYQDLLYVADSYKGLLRIDPKGKVQILSTEAGGVPFHFTDDVDIAKNGVVYFTDASHKFGQEDYKEDALEHRPNGRLLSYDPATETTKVLADGLYFANGVAVSEDESFVLVNETWKYRVIRYWLKGPKEGSTEILVDNLPGFPDGISRGEKDIFWLAIASPRDPIVDILAPYPFARKIISRLPNFLKPDAKPYASVFGLNSKGEVIQNLQDPNAENFSMITSVQQHGNRLWFGSLKEDALAYYDL